MIGGLTRAATSALRQLLDAGTLSNYHQDLNRVSELEMMPNLYNQVSGEMSTLLVALLEMPL